MATATRRRPRVLLCISGRGWAFENIARALKRHLHECRIETVSRDELQNGIHLAPQYDVAVVFWWPELPLSQEHVRARRWVLCLYDEVSWPDGVPDFPGAVQKADAMLVANRRIAARLEALDPRRPVWTCPDGVDTRLFARQPFPERFTIGWTGNSACRAGDYKGVELIREACRLAGVQLVTRDFQQGYIRQAEMPTRFYRHVSAYACASIGEGTPNPLLEAAACGRPVISTDVGLVPEVLRPGETGLIVQRDVQALAEAIREVRTWNLKERAGACRETVEGRDWCHAAGAWREMLKNLVEV